MEDKEKLENATIEFTYVTLMSGTGSDCEEDPNNPGTPTVKICKEDKIGNFG